MGANRLDRAPKDIKARLLVFTKGKHMWTLSEPDENGLRSVQYNGKEQGRGILLGSVVPIGLGYITRSSDIKVDHQLGVNFTALPKSKSIFISTPITAIMVGEEEPNKE